MQKGVKFLEGPWQTAQMQNRPSDHLMPRASFSDYHIRRDDEGGLVVLFQKQVIPYQEIVRSAQSGDPEATSLLRALQSMQQSNGM